MAINKNFVIKNGVEINTSLIVGDATLNKVGVGTTVPGYTLHVGGSRGGIGATDITITGIATVGTSGSTSAALSVVGVSSFQGDINFLGSAGVSTITFDASLDKLNFADNARATFGAGDDLQIFHDGSNSIIRETGTGNIVIEGSGETLAVFADDGAVSLYYDNTDVFQTTPQGINVTGVTTSTRLNVAGISTLNGGVRVGAAASIYTNGNVAFAGLATANGGLQVGTAASIYTNGNIAAAGIVTANGGLVVGAAITLAVNGNAAFTGIVTVGGDLKVTGDLEIAEDLVLDTNLNILGIATIGQLHVTGIGTIDSDVRVGGASTFVEIAKFEDDLAVGVSTFFVDKSTGRIGIGTGVPATTLDVAGSLTVNSAKVEDLTNNRVVIVGTDGELEDSGNLTFDGSTLALTGAQTVSSSITVSTGATISANGNAGFAGIITAKGVIDANGGVNATTAKIEDLTDNRVVIAGTGGELEDSGNLTFNGTTLAVTGDQTVSNGIKVGTAVTIGATGNVGFVGIVTAKGVIDADGGINASSAKVEDLTDNRVVIVGTGGELEDDSNLTFDGAMLKVGTAATIAVNGNAAFAGIVTVGGNLNVIGDIVYDEITGRNLNITGISTQAGQANFGTSGVGATIFANGNVTVSGILTASSFVGALTGDVTGNLTGTASNASGATGDFSIADKIIHTGDTNTAIRFPAADTFTVETSGSEAIRVDSSQRLLVGTTTSDLVAGYRTSVQIADTGDGSGVSIFRYTDNVHPATLNFGKSRSGTLNTNTLVSSGDSLGMIQFGGADGSSFRSAASITGVVDGTPGSGDMPGRLVFSTTADGASSATERLRITSAGRVNTVGIVSATGGVQVAAAATIFANGNATFSGIGTFGGTSHVRIPVGTTAQRDSNAVNGDIRYNTDLNSYEGYGNGAWGGLGGGTEIDTAVSSISATNITTFAHASYRSAQLRVQITQGSAYQVGKYLLIHDGTTVTVVEESAIATGDMLGNVSSVINGSNVEVKITMNSASSATVTTIIDKITV